MTGNLRAARERAYGEIADGVVRTDKNGIRINGCYKVLRELQRQAMVVAVRYVADLERRNRHDLHVQAYSAAALDELLDGPAGEGE